MPRHIFTETSRQGFFSRLGGSIKNILFGLLLFIAAIPFLFWNEGRAVKEYKSLVEGEGAVVSIDASGVLSGHDQSLVHFTGRAVSDQSISDDLFGIQVAGLRLNRRVEMLQWEEEEHSETTTNAGGSQTTTTRYEYEPTWSSRLIDSSDFRYAGQYRNPASMPFQSESFSVSDAHVGLVQLPQDLLNKIGGAQGLDPQDARLPQSTRRGQKYGEYLYYGNDPAQPEVGDVRIRFTFVPEQIVSIIAQLTGNQLQRYQAKAGGTLYMIKRGELSADQMFSDAHQSNKILTWVLRFVGFIMMFIGLSAILKPLRVVSDVIPFVGRLVGVGIGLVSGIIAFVSAITVIAMAWLFYRPLAAVGLLLMAAAALYFFRKADQKAVSQHPEGRPSVSPPPPPPPR